MMRRIKGLNRKVFKQNLKDVLTPKSYSNMDFEAYCEEYYQRLCATGSSGYYEVPARNTVKGYTIEVRTN